MAALGLSPSFLMNHVRLWGKVMRDEILGPQRADLLDRYASVTKAGIRGSFHCDFSVSGHRAVELHRHRRGPHHGRRGRGAQRRRAGVGGTGTTRGSTIDAAWMCHADGLVDHWPRARPPTSFYSAMTRWPTRPIRTRCGEIPVVATYLDGAAVHAG